MPDFKADFTDEDLKIDDLATFPVKVEKYRAAYNKLVLGQKSINEIKKQAEDQDSLKLFKIADKEEDRIAPYFFPFVQGNEQAKYYKENGFKLSSWDGSITGNGETKSVDPIVAMFLIADDAYESSLFGDPQTVPEAQSTSLLEVIKLIIEVMPILQAIRDKIIPPNDTGEIARLIRDPIKRPVEVMQNIRDKIIPASDTGEIAQIIRDPIKRPVEVIVNIVKKIFGW